MGGTGRAKAMRWGHAWWKSKEAEGQAVLGDAQLAESPKRSLLLVRAGWTPLGVRDGHDVTCFKSMTRDTALRIKCRGQGRSKCPAKRLSQQSR